MKKLLFYVLQLLILLLFLSSYAQTNSTNKLLYIKAGKLFDSRSGEILVNQIIKIKNNMIVDVGNDIDIKDDGEIIDLSDYFVSPGLIDSHTHLLSEENLTDPNPILAEIIIEGDALRVLRASKRAKSMLLNGYTTIKDLGNSGRFLDVALKKAIEEGTIIGPRMLVSGPILTTVGGQLLGISNKHDHIIEEEFRVIKSVEDAIHAVRENYYYGADLIKVCVANNSQSPRFTIEELRTIVKTAHSYNMKVHAHAMDKESIELAIQSKVDVIEHGNEVTKKSLAKMFDNNIALTSTEMSKELVYKYIDIKNIKVNKDSIYPELLRDKQKRFKKIMDSKITILTGSDSFINYNMPRGTASKYSLVAYYEFGMHPINILRSSTYLPAKFMNKENSIGSIKKGAYADIIAFDGDIENNFMKTIFKTIFVMKNGQIHLNKSQN